MNASSSDTLLRTMCGIRQMSPSPSFSISHAASSEVVTVKLESSHAIRSASLNHSNAHIFGYLACIRGLIDNGRGGKSWSTKHLNSSSQPGGRTCGGSLALTSMADRLAEAM